MWLDMLKKIMKLKKKNIFVTVKSSFAHGQPCLSWYLSDFHCILQKVYFLKWRFLMEGVETATMYVEEAHQKIICKRAKYYAFQNTFNIKFCLTELQVLIAEDHHKIIPEYLSTFTCSCIQLHTYLSCTFFLNYLVFLKKKILAKLLKKVVCFTFQAKSSFQLC